MQPSVWSDPEHASHAHALSFSSHFDSANVAGWLADTPLQQPLQPLDMGLLNAMLGYTDNQLLPWSLPPLDQPLLADALYPELSASLQLYGDYIDSPYSMSVDPRFVSEPSMALCTESPKAKRPRGRPRRSAIMRPEPYATQRPMHDAHLFINTFVSSTAPQQQQQPPQPQQTLTPHSPVSISSSNELSLYYEVSSNDDSMPPTPEYKPSSLSLEEDASSLAFPCCWNNCSRMYATLDQLVEHVVHVHVQSGRSFYVCEWKNCPRHGASFTKRHKMLTHVRTHTGEKPFICTFAGCQRAFTRADARVAHERIHQNVRPYACTVHGCGRRYYHARSLRKHVKVHADAPSPSDEEDDDDDDQSEDDEA